MSAASPWRAVANPVFVRIDTHLLPEAAVMAVAQDRSGLLWIGTQGGLARFDGYDVRTFLPVPGDRRALPDGYIRSLLADPRGGVWIGSSSSGLVRFDTATETFRTWRPDPAGRTGARSGSINAIVAGRDGTLWLGGDHGLSHFDPATERFTEVAIASRADQPLVWGMALDHSGRLWIATQAGLFVREPDGRMRPFALSRAPGMRAVYSVLEDGAHRLWAGAGDTLASIDPSRRHVRLLVSSSGDPATLAPGQQWAITEMHPGEIWAGTDSGISIVDAATLAVRRVAADNQDAGALTGGRVEQFFHDAAGNVWLANHVGGLLLFNPHTAGMFQISTTRPDVQFGTEGAIALTTTHDGRLWAGGVLGRLAAFTPGSSHVMRAMLPNRAAVQALLESDDGLWIGTTAGLCRLHFAAAAVNCLPSYAGVNIYAVMRDRDRLYIGGGNGLTIADATTGRPRAAAAPFRSRLSNSQVRVIFRDRERRLWIGTENGLNRLDPDGRFTRYVSAPGDAHSIGPGGMTTIAEDRSGRIWAGANGGPLNVLTIARDGTTRVRRVTRADGLPHENVDGIVQDATGTMWASTDRGIALIDPATLHAQALGAADGLTDGAFWAGAVTRMRDGTMFFGGLDGISIIARSAASPWRYAPPIAVSAIEVGHRAIGAGFANEPNATIDVPVDNRDLAIEFASLDYTAPGAARYAYRLTGYDRDWIEVDAGHRIASYSHVPPGTYTFEVRATNRAGMWSSHELRLTVRVAPAWYETWWFRCVIVLLVALGLYGAHVIRTAVLRRRGRELESLVSERTRALSAANARLQELSLNDPLTGLRNRRFLTQHIEPDIALALRRYEDWRDAPGSEPPQDADLLFFLIDLDHLKTVNDRYGHHAGDAVLVEMRERLHEVFREADFIVRWGGDEFLAVVRGSDRADAAGIAERMHAAVAGRAFAIGTGEAIAGSVSIGFAAFPFVPSVPAALSWSQVVRLADHALYMGKHGGRNTWFGLAATDATDPASLVRDLDRGADDVVRAGALTVVARYAESPTRAL